MLTRSFLAITLIVATPAFARDAAETGTGGGPTSTVTAPNTTAVGQTKPPGAAAGPRPTETREAHSDQMRKDEKIMKGICIGCGTK